MINGQWSIDIRDIYMTQPIRVLSKNSVSRHAGLDPASSPAYGGIRNTGFRLEFIPMKIGAGMTILMEVPF